MGEKIVVGPVTKGLRNDVTPFNIDNDAFPVLINAYQWRGRVKRKRGTSLLTRLQRYFNSDSLAYNSGPSTITLNGSGAGNLLTGFGLQDDTSSYAYAPSIVPGTVTITAPGPTVYTDPAENGTLSPSGSINYASGEIVILAEAGDAVSATFVYYPSLPVMGLRDFISNSAQYPGTLGFDTTYSYNIVQVAPYYSYDVSFYKNPVTSLPSYIQKSLETPTSWNGQNYQQFFTVNYQGALWATNGITEPFSITNIGMQFAPAATISFVAETATTIELTITNCPLVVGDFVFLNEWTASSAANAATLNYQSGYVITAVGDYASLTVTIKLPYADLASDTYVPGIVQYLTNRSNTSLDCLRWYDGDPTNGNPTSPTLDGVDGWVNFAPPISHAVFGVADLPEAQYYLVGARMIVPFKDRLLFLGPVVQTSSLNSQVYLQDTVIYSQNGTPYYTASFTGDPTLVTTTFTPILVPVNNTATPGAYWGDIVGYGGYITAGIDQEITTVGANEDVVIVGFTRLQTQLLYSGNDVVPFNFFVINAELGSGSTFSSVTMDRGVITRGSRGFIITSQRECQRIDLPIPDEVFEIGLTQNGNERLCAQRDFENEWIYFTYPVNYNNSVYPSQTLLYNYRDNSWAVFRESYTTYGSFRKQTGYTWATIGMVYPTWSVWDTSWNSGGSTLLQPQVIGGNSQGFVMIRQNDTGEGPSLQIGNISYAATITAATKANPAVLTANNSFIVGQNVLITGVVGMTQLNNNVYEITAVTPTTITLNVNSTAFTAYVSGGIATPSDGSIYSPGHALNEGDYIVISGCLGTTSALNGQIFAVSNLTSNGFNLSPPVPSGLTYLGGGVITRMYVPFIQTKQFPVAWGLGRKTRLGPQMYLLTRTAKGQLTLLIFLSQDADNAYNDLAYPFADGIVPELSLNNSLIYSATLYSCPESTNLGLTAANTNLQQVTAATQQQIWHRMNTSLLGDTVQVGFTLNDAQMRDTTFSNQMVEIEIHGIILDINPSSLLA